MAVGDFLEGLIFSQRKCFKEWLGKLFRVNRPQVFFFSEGGFHLEMFREFWGERIVRGGCLYPHKWLQVCECHSYELGHQDYTHAQWAFD